MYIQSFFATRLFIHGHLYSPLFHFNYILSLFSLHLSYTNVFYMRNSLLSVLTSFWT